MSSVSRLQTTRWGRRRENSLSRSSGSAVKTSMPGLSSRRAAEITSRYMAGPLAIKALTRTLCGQGSCANFPWIHSVDRGGGPPLEFCIDRSGLPAVRSSFDRDHAVAHGEDERLQPRRHFELGEDVGHVGVDRPFAHVE